MDLYESYKTVERLQEERLEEGLLQAGAAAIQGVKNAGKAISNTIGNVVGTKEGLARVQQKKDEKFADNQEAEDQAKATADKQATDAKNAADQQAKDAKDAAQKATDDQFAKVAKGPGRKYVQALSALAQPPKAQESLSYTTHFIHNVLREADAGTPDPAPSGDQGQQAAAPKKKASPKKKQGPSLQELAKNAMNAVQTGKRQAAIDAMTALSNYIDQNRAELDKTNGEQLKQLDNAEAEFQKAIEGEVAQNPQQGQNPGGGDQAGAQPSPQNGNAPPAGGNDQQGAQGSTGNEAGGQGAEGGGQPSSGGQSAQQIVSEKGQQLGPILVNLSKAGAAKNPAALGIPKQSLDLVSEFVEALKKESK